MEIDVEIRVFQHCPCQIFGQLLDQAPGLNVAPGAVPLLCLDGHATSLNRYRMATASAWQLKRSCMTPETAAQYGV